MICAASQATHGLVGLVTQDILDLLHDLGGQLGQDLEGLAVVGDLFGLGSTEDAGRDVLVLPGSEPRHESARLSVKLH